MKQTILITGGLGYLGGRISQFLAKYPEFRLILGTRDTAGVLPDWLERGQVISVNLMSEKELNNLCKGINTIIHLAAMNEIESASDPEMAMQINGIGTLKLIRAAEHSGVKRFIYFSTAHVYGSPLAGNITENMIPRPLHPYAITHRVAEDFVLAAHDKKIMTGIVLRLSNGTGSPADPNVNRWTLIGNDLCRQAVTTRKLILHSSGIQQRDFIPLYDVAQAVLHLLNLPSESCKDGLFNLGGENAMRIIDFAQLVANRCQKILGFLPLIIKPDPKQDEESLSLTYCIDKIKATGFSLKATLAEEIDSTLKLCAKSFEMQKQGINK